MKILVVMSVLPVEEGNGLLREVIAEIKERKDGTEKKAARLLICGAGLDNTVFMELVEESGANVVVDDICIGTKTYWHDVGTSGDILENIAVRYLEKIPCPRTYRERRGTYREDLESRFGYLYDFAKQFKVNGVIFYIVRYCDIYGFDLPDVERYLEDVGLPTLAIEEEYVVSSINRIQTRVQAFLEMITSAEMQQKR